MQMLQDGAEVWWKEVMAGSCPLTPLDEGWPCSLQHIPANNMGWITVNV